MTRALLLAALLAVPTSPAGAVIIRHDREDARYVEAGSDLSGICHLNLPDGEGVLIDPRWVLTAAHVAVEIRPGHRLTVVGREDTVGVEAEEVLLHPDWDGGAHDIALVRLARPPDDIEPVPLYRDHDEAQRIVTIGGTGDFGTGETGPTSHDGKLRAATNRVDEATDNWLKFRFDEGEQATDLEGVSGPGDSGGPAFLREDGSRFVAGVSSAQSTRDSGGREGVYGVREYYTRVSTHLEWIDGILRGGN